MMTELDKLLAARDVATTVDNYSTTQSKIDLLEQKRLEKQSVLGSKNQYADLADGYTVMPGGNLESNKNKIWNDLNDIELQYMLGYAAGDTSDSSRADEARRLYLYNTKQSNSKGGVSTGAADTSDVRYDNTIDPRYTDQWRRSGEDGPDLNNKMMDAKLKFDAATVAEGLLHGNKRLLDKRKYPNYLSDEALLHDGGVSEYYKGSVNELLGDASNQTLTPERERELQQMYENYKKLPGAQARTTTSRRLSSEDLDKIYSLVGEQTGNFGELGQTVAGATAGVGQGAVELLDAAQELATYPAQLAYNYVTGDNKDIDLFDDKQKEIVKKGIAELVGYDQQLDEESSKKAEELVEASGAKLLSPSTWQKLLTTEEGRGAIKEYLTNPSLTANSLTQIFGTGGAGAVVKGGVKLTAKGIAGLAGKGAAKATDKFIINVESKLATNATRAKEEIKSIKASGLSNADKLSAIKAVKDSYTYDKKLIDVLKGTTFTNSDFAVRANNHITAYKENNNGEDPDLGKLASILLVDKFLAEAEIFSAKRLAGISDLPKEQVANTIKQKLFEHVKDMGLNMPMEAMQEGFDALGSVINEKYGSDKYKDKTLTELLEAESSSIISQILAGGTAGAHASGARAAFTGVTEGVQAGRELVTDKKSSKPTKESVQEAINDVDADVDVEEETKARQTDKQIIDTVLNVYDKQDQATNEDVDNVKAAIAEIDKSTIEEEDRKQLQKIYEVIEKNYRTRVESGQVTLKSKEDLMDLMDDINIQDEDALDEKLIELGSKAGILSKENAVEEYKRIKKDMYTVNEEATVGKKGYYTQGKELRSLIKSGSPDNKKIQRKVRELQRFEKSQKDYVDKAERLLADAKKWVNDYNNSKTEGASTELELAQFKKKFQNVVMNKAGDKLTIQLGKDTTRGNLELNVKGLESVLESKKNNIKGIQVELQRSAKDLEALGISAATTGVSSKPVVNKGASKQIARVAERLEKLAERGNVKFATIDASAKTYTGKLTALNKEAVNVGEYTKDDVVFLTVNNPKTQEEFDALKKELAKGGTLYAEIQAAKKAGATIAIDTEVSKDTKFDTKQGKKTVKQTAYKALTNAVSMYSDIKYSKIGKSESTKVSKDKGIQSIYRREEDLKEGRERYKKLRQDSAKKGRELDAIYKKISNAESTINEMYIENKEKLDGYFKSKEDKSSSDMFKEYIENKVKREAKELAEALKTITSKAAANNKKAEYGSVVIELADRVIANKAKQKGSLNTLAKRIKEVLDNEAIEDKETEVEELIGTYEGYNDQLIQEMLDNTLGKDNKAINVAVEGKHLAKKGETVDQGTKAVEGKKIQLDTSLSKYVKAIKTTSLLQYINPRDLILEEGYYDGTVEWLKKVYKDQLENTFTLVDSPAAALVFDTKGNVNETVALAMELGLGELVAFSGNILHPEYKTKKDTAQMVGVLESQLSGELYKLLADKGAFNKTLANKVGKSILKKLGIVYSKAEGTEKEMYDRLAADIGNMAIMSGIEQGLLVEDEISVSEYKKANGESSTAVHLAGDKTIAMVKINPELYIDENGRLMEVDTDGTPSLIRRYKEEYADMHELVMDEQTSRKGYKSHTIFADKRRHVNEQVSKDIAGLSIADESGDKKSPTEFINELIDIEWEPELDNIKRTVEIWQGTDLDMSKETLLAYLGYNTEEDLGKMTLDSRKAAESVNREIESSLEMLVELQKDMENRPSDKQSLYFDWFYSSNGRYMMDSNTINPQTDKLHRFLLHPKEHMTTYQLVRNNDGQVIDVKYEGQSVMVRMQYAIAQAFGYAIDKKNEDSVVEFANRMLKIANDETELKELEEAFNNGDKKKLEELGVEVEHFSHTMQGIKLLKDMAIDNDEVSTALTAEYDAVTSGFGLKLLQFPIVENIYGWLKKVGVFTDKKDMPRSMNDLLDSGSFTDSYQELATKARPGDHAKDLGVIEKGLWEVMENTLPKLDDNGKVSKELRNLFKDPFMTFNYAAGIASIKRSLAGILTTGVLNDVIAEKNEATLEYLTEMVYGNSFENNKDKLIESLKTKPLASIKLYNSTKNLEAVLMSTMEGTYGATVQEIMEDKFRPFMELNDVVNGAFRIVFDQFKLEYDKRKAEYPTGQWNDEAFKEVMYGENGLINKFPVIKGPLSDSIKNGVGVYKSGSQTPTGEARRYPRVQTKTGSTEKGKATKGVNHEIRDFEAAISAGSVIPIHYIDAAIMAQLNGRSITSIHDAVMPPLVESKDTIKAYNKAVYEVSRDYSIMDEIIAMVDRVKGKMTDAEFKKLIDDTTKDGVRVKNGDKRSYVTSSGKDKGKFKASSILDELKAKHTEVTKMRKEVFDSIEGIAHMAGMRDSMWAKEETKENVSIIDQIKDELASWVDTDDKNVQELLKKAESITDPKVLQHIIDNINCK